jgi:thiamine kinase-like enzyme
VTSTGFKDLKKIVPGLFSAGIEFLEPSLDISSVNSFWVIPGKSGAPRWLLPEDPRLGLPGLKYWAPYDILSRLKWFVIVSAYRMGRLGWLPGVHKIGIADHGLKIIEEQIGNAKLIPVFYLAEYSARCKAVAFLVDTEKRQCMGVAKFPIGQRAGEKIRSEAKMLVSLNEEGVEFIPKLLYWSEQSCVSVQEVMSLKNTKRILTENHIRWLASLRQDGTTTLYEQVSRLKARLETWQELDSVRAVVCNGWLDELADTILLSVVWCHGDFAPWNFKYLPGDRYTAIDWEEAISQGLPLYDLCHYYFIQQYINKKPFQIADFFTLKPVQSYMRQFDLSRRIGEQIFRYFMLDYWCRRLEENEMQLAEQLFAYIKPMLESKT